MSFGWEGKKLVQVHCEHTHDIELQKRTSSMQSLYPHAGLTHNQTLSLALCEAKRFELELRVGSDPSPPEFGVSRLFQVSCLGFRCVLVEVNVSVSGGFLRQIVLKVAEGTGVGSRGSFEL